MPLYGRPEPTWNRGVVEQAESDQDLLSIFAAEQELQGKFVRSPSICHYIDKNFQNFLMLGPLQAKVEGEIGLSVFMFPGFNDYTCQHFEFRRTLSRKAT